MFNTLRNDFALALNARGYNYQNKSRLEKDLQKEIESLKENKFQSKVFVNEILQKEQIALGKKLENFDKKIKKSKELLKNLYNEKNALLLQALENQRDNNKIYFKQYKEVKIYNERIRDLTQTTKSMIKQHSTLKKEFIRLDNYNHGKEVGDFYSSLQEKKKYIEFIEKNYLRKNLSKNQVALIERFKREIALNEQSFRENTKEYLEHRAIMDSIFSANFKNANGFRFLRVQNELFNNSLACALDESLSKRYDENGKCVKNLIKMRYSYLANSLSKKDKIKEFEFKEIEALSRNLGLKNAELLNALSLKVLRDSKKSAKEKLTQQKNISKTLESKSSVILQSAQVAQENRVNMQNRGR